MNSHYSYSLYFIWTGGFAAADSLRRDPRDNLRSVAAPTYRHWYWRGPFISHGKLCSMRSSASRAQLRQEALPVVRAERSGEARGRYPHSASGAGAVDASAVQFDGGYTSHFRYQCRGVYRHDIGRRFDARQSRGAGPRALGGPLW